MGTQLPLKRGHITIFSQCLLWRTAGWTKIPLGTEVDLGPGDTVLDGNPALPHEKGHSSPHFSAHVYCGQTVAHLSNCWYRDNGNGTLAAHYDKDITLMLSDIATTLHGSVTFRNFDIIYQNCTILMCHKYCPLPILMPFGDGDMAVMGWDGERTVIFPMTPLWRLAVASAALMLSCNKLRWNIDLLFVSCCRSTRG